MYTWLLLWIFKKYSKHKIWDLRRRIIHPKKSLKDLSMMIFVYFLDCNVFTSTINYSLVKKQGTSREITRPCIVNCPLIIDPEMVTLKKIMGDPKAGCISLMTSSNQSLPLLSTKESFRKIEWNYMVKNHNSFLHQKWFSGLSFNWIKNSITGVYNRKKNYDTPNKTNFGVENLWILWTCLINIRLVLGWFVFCSQSWLKESKYTFH